MDDWATLARDDKAKGITGTMIPYRKMSVKTATHIVVKIKSFDDLMCRRYGGGEVESSRAPEMKFFSLPMIYYKRSVGYQAEFRGLTPASVMCI
jgi:hypothetical protein